MENISWTVGILASHFPNISLVHCCHANPFSISTDVFEEIFTLKFHIPVLFHPCQMCSSSVSLILLMWLPVKKKTVSCYVTYQTPCLLRLQLEVFSRSISFPTSITHVTSPQNNRSYLERINTPCYWKNVYYMLMSVQLPTHTKPCKYCSVIH